MMHFNPAILAALSPAKIKAEALKAFETACASPVEATDWQGLTLLMHAALTAKPKRKSDSDIPGWWACDTFSKKAVRVSIEVTFADGQVVRASVNTDPGKTFNIGRGLKTACAFYRQRIFRAAGCPEAVRIVRYGRDREGMERTLAGTLHVNVPEIVGVVRLDTGEAFDAAECSRLTTSFRAGAWTLTEARDRASRVAEPEGPCIYDADEARSRWIAYQVQLDYVRAWLATSPDLATWSATTEEAWERVSSPVAAVEDQELASSLTVACERLETVPAGDAVQHAEPLPDTMAIAAECGNRPEADSGETFLATATSHRSRLKLLPYAESRVSGTYRKTTYRVRLEHLDAVRRIKGVRISGLPRTAPDAAGDTPAPVAPVSTESATFVATPTSHRSASKLAGRIGSTGYVPGSAWGYGRHGSYRVPLEQLDIVRRIKGVRVSSLPRSGPTRRQERVSTPLPHPGMLNRLTASLMGSVHPWPEIFPPPSGGVRPRRLNHP